MEEKIKKKPGRVGKPKDDPIAEAKRLIANQKSREAKAKKRQFLKQQGEIRLGNFDNMEDNDGIRPVDERRYKQCFTAGYIGIPVPKEYVKRMTGLTDKQIDILAKRTKLKPIVTTKIM